MKIKIPKLVNILGHKYKVIMLHPDKLRGRLGECEHPSRIIRIANNLGKELAWTVFLHELKHAQQFECGLTQIMDHQAQEMDCDLFSNFISSLQKQGIL